MGHDSVRRGAKLARALTVCALVALAPGCRDATGPKLGPDPFPNAIPLKAWLSATGIVVPNGRDVRLSVTVLDSSTLGLAAFPPGPFDRWPYRIAWWTSDPTIALVSDSGRLFTKATGKVQVWVRVEGGRDSATIVVGTNTGGPAEAYVSVEPGMGHTCALGGTGIAYCWGWDFGGMLGRGTLRAFTSGLVPAPVAGGHAFTAVTTGYDFACGLTAEGQAYCWGSDMWGEIGDGANMDDFSEPYTFGRPAPTLVQGGITFRLLVAGGSTACGLDLRGAAYCWGNDALGETGAGSLSTDNLSRTHPTAVVGGLVFAALAAGASHMCGLTTSGQAYCWGSNIRNELGHDSLSDPACGGGWRCSTSPVAAASGFTFVAMAAGAEHTCGLDAGGAIFCWGANGSWQLGTDSVGMTSVPVPVDSPLRFKSLTASGFHTCGLTADGTAYCWGDNLRGQLGIGLGGPPYAYSSPQRVAGGLSFRSLSAGAHNTCGIATDGTLYCWGWNHLGQVGNGTPQPPNSGYYIVTGPVQVQPPLMP